MQDLLILSYLKDHTFQQLEDEHGVCVRFSNDNTKFSANYDQILVKNGDKLAEQCRGLVLRPQAFSKANLGDLWKDHVVGDCSVVAWPMDRFYNSGDSVGADINWSDPDLKVFEKLDGTMIVFYYDHHKNDWFAATRAVPEADLPFRHDDVTLGEATFSDLFKIAFAETLVSLGWCDSSEASKQRATELVFNSFSKHYTYVFELTSPWNRVVVKYDVPRICLLAVRNILSGMELPLSRFVEATNCAGLPTPQTWSLRNASAVAAFVDSADPIKVEGAVVCDSKFRRLKVKNKSWVLSSKAKDLVTVSRRSAVEAALLGKLDDVIPIVDADTAKKLTAIQDGLKRYFLSVDERFAQFKLDANGSRRDFALKVQASGDFSPAYFAMWEGKHKTALSWARAAAESAKLSASTYDVILSKLL